MVEIIAIVRPNKTAETKQALLDIGKPGFTCVRVSGRGKQAVVRTFMDGSVITTGLNNKRMFIIPGGMIECDLANMVAMPTLADADNKETVSRWVKSPVYYVLIENEEGTILFDT